MRPVTQYESNDGSIWSTEVEATKRDALLSAIADAMAPMGQRPNDRQFSDGRSYVQHAPEAVLQTKRKLVAIARKEHSWWFDDHPNINPDDVHPMGIVGRILSDNPGPLNDAWYRLTCTDSQGREWRQTYYVAHPTPGATPLNPEPTKETTS